MIRAVAKEKEPVLLLVSNFEQEKTAPYGAANQKGSAVALWKAPHGSQRSYQYGREQENSQEGKEMEVYALVPAAVFRIPQT
jgi:hypothetical protein